MGRRVVDFRPEQPQRHFSEPDLDARPRIQGVDAPAAFLRGRFEIYPAVALGEFRRERHLSAVLLDEPKTSGRPLPEHTQQQRGSVLSQLIVKFSRGLVRLDPSARLTEYCSGVHLRGDENHGIPGPLIARQHGVHDRRGSAPSGQQRSVEVDRKPIPEHLAPKFLPERDHHKRIRRQSPNRGDGTRLVHILGRELRRLRQRRSRPFHHGSRSQSPSPPGGPVGLAHDADNLMFSGERPQ